MRVLITGANGFVGSHLIDYLNLQSGVEVWGMRRRGSSLANIAGQVSLIECDILDYRTVEGVIEKVRPDRIFHLAAQSFVPASWEAPSLTLSTNILGSYHILEATRRIKPDARILLAGSSEEYGLVHPHECPITEAQPLRPQSPYGVSKVAMDLLGQQYARSYGLHVVVTRAFNHTGPQRGEEFVTSNFAKQIALIEAGLQPPTLYVGNLEAQRDWTDVRDIVRAYWLALDKCPAGEPFNICSGHSVSIRLMLDNLLSQTDKKIVTQVDPTRMRPSDVPLLIGSCEQFRRVAGWQPTIPFAQTLDDLLAYWRARLSVKESVLV